MKEHQTEYITADVARKIFWGGDISQTSFEKFCAVNGIKQHNPLNPGVKISKSKYVYKYTDIKAAIEASVVS